MLATCAKTTNVNMTQSDNPTRFLGACLLCVGSLGIQKFIFGTQEPLGISSRLVVFLPK
jgi:hypothetical protein